MLGPVMVGIDGLALDAAARELLRHPLVGGVILFHRNYESPEQLAALAREIHALRHPRLLIAVDQEGGRVQRFREGLTPLPPPAAIGRLWREDRRAALGASERLGWLMAAELRALDVDLSFAPVLDLGRVRAGVIGDRAFGRSPEQVAALGQAWMRGARRAGMAAVGKHFPGHGGVRGDSHRELPEDPRPLADLVLEDLVPFERLIHAGLPGVMTAHVLYSAVDALPATFSRRWIGGILRGELGFQGAVFSDDLGMAGAAGMGDPPRRARAALEAGCDMVLACTATLAAEVLDGLHWDADPAAGLRLARLHGHGAAPGLDDLRRSRAWREASALAARLHEAHSMDLDLE